MNLAFVLGSLWGMHDAEKANNEIDLNKINIDHLIDLTRDAKRFQIPEKFILDGDEKDRILYKLKKANVNNEAVEIIEYAIDKSIFKRTSIKTLLQALID